MNCPKDCPFVKQNEKLTEQLAKAKEKIAELKRHAREALLENKE